MWRFAPRILAAIFLLLPAAGFAADAGVLTPQQKDYLGSPQHQKESGAKLREISPLVFPNCEGISINSESVTMSRPIEFDSNGDPRVGVWKEVYNGAGCGKTRKLTLFWYADEKGVLNAVAGMPGNTIAQFEAQKVALGQAVQAGAGKVPGCGMGTVDDTRFDMVLMLESKPPEPPITSSWHEIWTIAACGHLLDVPLTYAQSGTSLKITADPGGVVEHKTPAKTSPAKSAPAKK